MHLETTRTVRGVTFTVRGAQRQTLRFRHFAATLGVDPQDQSDLGGARFDFCYIAGHLTALDGAAWQPPETGASKKALAQSFEDFLDALPQAVTAAMLDAIAALYVPLSSAEERPDETLTPEQVADPN